MNCPNCGSKMEREDYYEKIDHRGETQPSALYHCEDCDYTALWRRGQGLEAWHDPRQAA